MFVWRVLRIFTLRALCCPYLFETLILFAMACIYFHDAESLCILFVYMYIFVNIWYAEIQYVYIIYPYPLWAEFI